MSIKHHATIADLYAAEGKAELVGGELVLMSATGLGPGYAAGRISYYLIEYEDRTGAGVSLPDGVSFLVNLPHRQSFSPDAAFYNGRRGQPMKFVEGAPICAAEVRSECDYGPAAEREIAAKRADYFAAGTQVVWDVDLLSPDVVRVYRADNPVTPTIYRRGDMVEAEPALPGWTMPVDRLFLPDSLQ